MTDLTDPSEVRGKKLVDPAGADIGEARETYMEHGSDRPAFALVKTGLFGSKHTFVPLSGASLDGPRIWVTVEKDRVKDAPRVDPDQELSPQEEGELYRHYGLEGSPDAHRRTLSRARASRRRSSGPANRSRVERRHSRRIVRPAPPVHESGRTSPPAPQADSRALSGRMRRLRTDRPDTEPERPAAASAHERSDAGARR